jgi:AcrR family transcriptional regulator
MARTIDLEHRADLAARAFEVIRARGVHRTSMSDLATALGIKRPTLYFYFRDLGAVFEAVLDATQRAYLGFVGGHVAGVAHPIDLLATVLRASAEFHRTQRDRIVVLFQLWAAGGADAESVLARNREFTEPFRRHLVQELARGVASGEVAPCEPDRIVDLALAVLDGALVHQITRAVPATGLVDEFERRVLTPLRVAPAPPSGRARPRVSRAVPRRRPATRSRA